MCYVHTSLPWIKFSPGISILWGFFVTLDTGHFWTTWRLPKVNMATRKVASELRHFFVGIYRKNSWAHPFFMLPMRLEPFNLESFSIISPRSLPKPPSHRNVRCKSPSFCYIVRTNYMKIGSTLTTQNC